LRLQQVTVDEKYGEGENAVVIIHYQVPTDHAKLPLAKDIDDFDFTDTPINETLVRD
jgi:hypothetical protein